MQLGSSSTDLRAVESMIEGNSVGDSKYHRHCLRDFRTFEYGDARGGVPEAPRGLDSGLDGEYWEEK